MSDEISDCNFDCLFILAEADETISTKHLAKDQETTSNILNKLPTQPLHRPRHTPGGSRGGSGPGSRGSPARRPTKTTLCPSNPALLGTSATKSQSMRDQTGHMKEKYQTKYQQRRMSIKTPTSSKETTPKVAGSRNNSLTPSDVEVTRQFLATNKKVINRGDSFKKRDKTHVVKQDINEYEDIKEKEKVDEHPKHIYRVVFIGSGEVGKTSIIDQFMSSEHADVYEDIIEEQISEKQEVQSRILTVDVNNSLTHLSLIEITTDNDINEMVEETNPDCYVLVYAVDDVESFDSIKTVLSYLSDNSCLSGKSVILVGNKSDLARTREIDTGEGCDLAMRFSIKYIETSPGMGHMIDELLVGIVMQCRMSEHRYIPEQSSIKQSIIGLFKSIIGNREDKRKYCRNLNM